MGIIIPPLPPTYVAGTDCTRCWGVDKSYGPHPTPMVINFIFNGIYRSEYMEEYDFEPAPNGVTFAGVQVEETPCSWAYEDETWLAYLQINDGVSQLNLGWKSEDFGTVWYFSNYGAMCSPNYTNILGTPGYENYPYYGGAGMYWW